jgi:hypothetical protein
MSERKFFSPAFNLRMPCMKPAHPANSLHKNYEDQLLALIAPSIPPDFHSCTLLQSESQGERTNSGGSWGINTKKKYFLNLGVKRMEWDKLVGDKEEERRDEFVEMGSENIRIEKIEMGKLENDASKTEHKNTQGKLSKKFVKIAFDTRNHKDIELLAKLDGFILRSAKNHGVPKARPHEILKCAIELITDDFILKHQRNSMTDEQRLNFWTDNYNRQHGTKLGPLEFAVRVMPKLKSGELNFV